MRLNYNANLKLKPDYEKPSIARAHHEKIIQQLLLDEHASDQLDDIECSTHRQVYSASELFISSQAPTDGPFMDANVVAEVEALSESLKDFATTGAGLLENGEAALELEGS